MTATVQPRAYRYKHGPTLRIEAVQLTDGADWQAIADWCGGRLVNYAIADTGEYDTVLDVGTPGDDLTAVEGDWIARTPSGDVRVYEPRYFAAICHPAA